MVLAEKREHAQRGLRRLDMLLGPATLQWGMSRAKRQQRACSMHHGPWR